MRILNPKIEASKSGYEYLSPVQDLAEKTVIVRPLEFVQVKGQVKIQIELQAHTQGSPPSIVEAHCELAAILPLRSDEEIKTALVIEAAPTADKNEQAKERAEGLWPTGVRPFSYPEFDTFSNRKIV